MQLAEVGVKRQARIEQAKLEANYAQKQLDIQKKMGSGTFEINKIQASRSITDLQAQVNLLVQERSLVIDSAAAQKAIEAMNQQEDLLIAKAQTYAEEGRATAAMWNQTWTDIEAKSGRVFADAGQGLADAFSAAGTAFINAINKVTNPASYGSGYVGSETRYTNTSGNGGKGATGLLGMTGGTTSLTVGEVKGEAVAVLRNPRTMSLPGGGGGGGGVVNVNVNINGGDASEEKLRAWAKQIQSNVETALNRKTSLLGLRNP